MKILSSWKSVVRSNKKNRNREWYKFTRDKNIWKWENDITCLRVSNIFGDKNDTCSRVSNLFENETMIQVRVWPVFCYQGSLTIAKERTTTKSSHAWTYNSTSKWGNDTSSRVPFFLLSRNSNHANEHTTTKSSHAWTSNSTT
jgi:hypothetical protein